MAHALSGGISHIFIMKSYGVGERLCQGAFSFDTALSATHVIRSTRYNETINGVKIPHTPAREILHAHNEFKKVVTDKDPFSISSNYSNIIKKYHFRI